MIEIASALRSAFATELSTASRKMRTLFNGYVKERGLTLARARALLLLSRNPTMNQTELACALEIESPTAVRLLDGLEKQGLIERIAVAGDRRANRIALTDAAQAQVEQLEALSATLTATMLRGVEAADLTVALDVLRKVVRNTETVAS